jgi:hypothetical protein
MIHQAAAHHVGWTVRARRHTPPSHNGDKGSDGALAWSNPPARISTLRHGLDFDMRALARSPTSLPKVLRYVRMRCMHAQVVSASISEHIPLYNE